MKLPTAGECSPLRLLALVALVVLMMAFPSLSFSNYCMMGNIERHAYTSVSSLPHYQREYRSLQMMMLSSSSSSDTPSSTTSTLNEEQLTEKFSFLRTIGVDYGLTRTGIAITTGGYRPRPLAILSGLYTAELCTTVVNYVQSERATNIVLGLPLHKNGTASEQSGITRMFAQELLREVRCRCGPDIDLALWDERYTSKEAASRITAQAMAKNQRIPSASDLNTELDADAACIILEDYYKERGVDGELVTLNNATLANECEEKYKQNLEKSERMRLEQMEGREKGRNARKEMMERVRAMEEANGVNNGNDNGEGKKKKKKKKKKKR